MIIEEPKVGQEIEYTSQYGPHDVYTLWKPAGRVVGVEGNICLLWDPAIPWRKEDGYSSGVNNSFIWRFHDGLNKLHRVRP